MQNSSVYKVDPKSVRFDESIVEFNRKQTSVEYAATKLSIKAIGQTTPISINNQTGLCENGRHRVKICSELGIQVKCEEIDGTIPLATRMEIYNLEQFSGRDLTASQKAVQAYQFATKHIIKLDAAAARFKSTVRNINDVTTIAGLGRLDVISAVKDTGEWLIPGETRPTKSLRKIASYLRATAETVDITLSDTADVDYTEYIHTERGKAEFYAIRTAARNSDAELSMLIVTALNYKYKPKVDPVTDSKQT